MSSSPDSPVVSLSRVLPASPARVWRCLTEPVMVARWYSSPDATARVTMWNLFREGEWQVKVAAGEPEPWVVGGIFKEISSPLRLVHTWAWASDPDQVSTVTFDLEPEGAGTRVGLTHEGLPEGEVFVMHDESWKKCFERLEQLVVDGF